MPRYRLDTLHGGPLDGRLVRHNVATLATPYLAVQPGTETRYVYRLERCTDGEWRWLGEDVQPVQLGMHYEPEYVRTAWQMLERRACELGFHTVAIAHGPDEHGPQHQLVVHGWIPR